MKDILEIVDAKYRDLKAEIALLAYVMKRRLHPQAEEGLFSSPPHRFLFKVARAHNGPVPKAVALDEIERRVPSIRADAYRAAADRAYGRRVKTLTAKGVRSLLARLKRMAASRTILVDADRIVDSVLDGKLDAARQLGRGIALAGKRPGSQYAGDYLADFEERRAIVRARRKNPDRVGIPTGIRKFDAAAGGLMPGEFAIILGQTNIGKSMMLENLALNAWLPELNAAGRAHNVLYVSIEMTKHELEFRADARLARVEHMKFRLGRGWTKEDARRWKSRIEDLRNTSETFLHFECVPRHCTPSMIEAVAERVQDEYGRKLDLLIVDYLNILGADGEERSGSKQWYFQADIAWQLKALATDFNDGEGLALWTANQLTDEGARKEVLDFTATKYGRAAAEVAPVVVGLVRTQDDALKNQMQLQVVKHRGARRVDPIILRPNLDFCTMDDERRGLKTLEAL